MLVFHERAIAEEKMLNSIRASSLVFHAIPYAYDADGSNNATDVATDADVALEAADANTYDADGATIFFAHDASLALLSFCAYVALLASNEYAADNATWKQRYSREAGDN
jgi:hypothetical protein